LLNIYPVGFDPGNSETSLVALLPNDGQATLTIPSYAGRGSSSDLKRFRTMHTAQSDILQPGEYVLRCMEIDSSEYFVGALALSQSQLSTSARGDINRYWSTLMLLLLLTALGTVIPDTEFEVVLVTGIPIETYSEQNRLKVCKTLEGEHSFILNGRERLAIVQVAKVIMEGAGAMIAYGDERMLRQAVIDIGGRTTDLYTADGQMPLIPWCKGAPLGVELGGDMLNRAFKERSGRALTVQETRGILRAAVGSGQYPLIYAHGQEVSPVDLHHLADDALRSVGRDITTFLSQTWASGELGAVGTDLAKVLQVGGGAYYFYRDIARLIPHATVPLQPELANALGYAELARHLQTR
jgi:plasmid segregation protein ParM